VLLGIGLRLAENGGSSLYQALAVSYIVKVVGLRGSTGTLSLVFAASVGALVDLTRFSGRVFAIRLCRFAGELSPFEVDW